MKRILAFGMVVCMTVAGITAGALARGHKKDGRQCAEQQCSAAKTVYTCPMHPDVTSDTPGNCPKCGMFLEKKEVAAGQQAAITSCADNAQGTCAAATTKCSGEKCSCEGCDKHNKKGKHMKYHGAQNDKKARNSHAATPASPACH
jgi:hypothetical protein